MSTRNARRVANPGDSTPESQEEGTYATKPLPSRVGSSYRIVQLVGPDALDRPRIAARHLRFPNTTAERRYLAAIDRAAFDRVHQYEALMMDNAERDIDRAATSATAADDAISALNDLADRLNDGEYSEDMVKDFNSLRLRAQQTILTHLNREARSLETHHLPKLEDPYKAAQDTWAEMPDSTFNPLDPTPYL